MASMKDIKLRIKSVESTMQITKAMELVASSKLKKAREKAEKSLPYFEALEETLQEISAASGGNTSRFMAARPVNKSAYLLIAGDRGLAGGYNANVFKLFEQHRQGKNIAVIPMGKKAVEYCKRRGYEIITEKYYLTEEVTSADCVEIGKLAADLFRQGEIDEFFTVYTEFVSMLTQTAQLTQNLPVVPKAGEVKKGYTEFEPDAESLFDMILPQYLSGVICGAVAQSGASEQAARRTAMDSASKNAGEIVDGLSLAYNRARQAAITQEITEIVGGAGEN